MTIEDLVRGAEHRLGLCAASGSPGMNRRMDQARVQTLQGRFPPALLPGIALIIPGHILHARWMHQPDERKSILQKISSLRIPAVFLSGSRCIPDYFDPLIRQGGISVMASVHDEFLLESRLRGRLREKIERICFMHGVLLNVFGSGVLLAGDSGIGKTTLGIRLARRGHLWVADDVIEIERKGSRLLARGHRRSRRLVHVKASGITETRRIIKQGNRLDETVLDMVIEAVRRDRPRPGGASKDKEAREILSIMVPCLEIAVDTGRYMTVSRVEQAVHSVFKRRQEG